MKDRRTVKDRKKPPKPLSRTKLIKELDRVFSLWVRKRDRNICFTCGGEGNQAGHYHSRTVFHLRWDARNVHCQCVRCNVFLHGNYPVYAEKLIKTLGFRGFRELNEDSRKLSKYTREDLETMIAHYKAL